ncbi:HalOD1 output domain-containing protein [Haloarcula amylovorans]|uniref:HalOD1 output domain-containing protein n=1 Tax=Haloarcula amylovorans TaxID=2562280 RepID=UPI001076BCEC|nr:HalOD1 output domain-containing protein [Halomicroarcula amylolytica]
MSDRETEQRHVERTVGDVSSTEKVTHAIVAAVADATNTPISALETSLYDVVEPDALADILASSASNRVSFAYEDCMISIASDGTVLVDPNPALGGYASSASHSIT